MAKSVREQLVEAAKADKKVSVLLTRDEVRTLRSCLEHWMTSVGDDLDPDAEAKLQELVLRLEKLEPK